METIRSLASTPGYRARRTWMRGLARMRNMAMAMVYGVLGLSGVALWLLMQLPMSARWKEAVVIAMAGCFGLFTLGWQMLRTEHAQTPN